MSTMYVEDYNDVKNLFKLQRVLLRHSLRSSSLRSPCEIFSNKLHKAFLYHAANFNCFCAIFLHSKKILLIALKIFLLSITLFP